MKNDVPCVAEKPRQAQPNARADAVATAAFRRTSRRICVVRVRFAASARHANVIFQTAASTTDIYVARAPIVDNDFRHGARHSTW